MSRSRVALFAVLCFTLLPLPVPGQEATGQQQAPSQEREVVPEPELVVHSGTVIPIVLTAYLNTRSTQAGDRLYAEVTYPVWVQQRLVIPRGSVVRGTVTEVVRPGRVKGRGRLSVRFDDVLLPNGVVRPLVAGFRGIHGPGEEKVDRTRESVEMDSGKGDDAGQIVGSGVSGAIIGVLAGDGKGAAIGGGVGAAVGLATVLFSRGRELVLAPGTQFDMELKQPLRYAFGELDFAASEMNAGQRWADPPRQRYDRDDRSQPPYYPFPSRRRLPFPVIWP